MAVPHSGMLGRPLESWPEDGLWDRQKDMLRYRNRTWTFPELAKERSRENFEALLAIEEQTARSLRCIRAAKSERDGRVRLTLLEALETRSLASSSLLFRWCGHRFSRIS